MRSVPWIIILAVLVYGFLHSLLATVGTKRRLREWLGPVVDRWYRLVYNTVAVLSILPILALTAALPGETLYTISPPWLYVSLTGQLVALIGLAIGLLQTGVWSFLGFEQVLNPSPKNSSQMVITGLYRWVRHPLYTAGLLFIWLTPIMTTSLLALNIGLTLYLVLGAIYEERKLVREYGEIYIHYQQRTPMLIPGLSKIWQRNIKGGN